MFFWRVMLFLSSPCFTVESWKPWCYFHRFGLRFPLLESLKNHITCWNKYFATEVQLRTRSKYVYYHSGAITKIIEKLEKHKHSVFLGTVAYKNVLHAGSSQSHITFPLLLNV